MRASRSKPFDVVPGKDVFGNVVNPGDAIAMATKSAGSAYISKGRYLGSRKLSYYGRDRFCYVVEQDLAHSDRTSSTGELWHDWRVFPNPRVKEQDQEVSAAIGNPPASPTRRVWDVPRNQQTPTYLAEVQAEWEAYRKAADEYQNKKEAWLDEHYPYKSTPYVRRSTLWLNKIIKL